MLVQLELQRFRGFQGFSARLEPLTAFLGPNSSGKTTALQAIRLACDALLIAAGSDEPAKLIRDDRRAPAAESGPRRVGWIQIAEGLLLQDHHRLMPLADWRALFVDQITPENHHFSITLTFEERDPIQAVAVEVVCARLQQLKLNVHVKSHEAWRLVEAFPKKSSRINNQLTAFIRARAPAAVFVPPFYGTVLAEEHRARVVIDRLLGSGDQSHVVRNLVAALDSDRFAQLNAFLLDTLGAQLTYRTSGDALQSESPMLVRFRDTNGDIEISAAGAGLVNLISLYAALSRWRHASAERSVIFLLDEPEAHLHPRLQAESAQRLGQLVTRDFGAQLVLATHSVDILNHLALSGALLLRCDRSTQPSVVELRGDSALFDELSGWADLTPYTAINFLASRRMLFYEGDDEGNLLPKLGELRLRNDPARLAAFRRWGMARLEGAGNERVAALLTRLLRSDALASRARGPGCRVIVVLDRDYERTPGSSRVDGPETPSSGLVDELRVVWSKYSLESLLLDPPVLARWVRAFAGETSPPELDALIARAAAAADADPKLNEYAVDRLLPRLHRARLDDPSGEALDGDRRLIHASRRARELVQGEPATWQRGKDRGRLMLGIVRDHLPLPLRNQFPTNIIDLVRRTPSERIGDTTAAIPAEVRALIDAMAAPTDPLLGL